MEIDPRLGARVAPISLAHLRDTYRVRGLLEAIAVRESVECGDPGWEAGLRESFQSFESAVARSQRKQDVTTWSPAHELFHESLMAACTSQWLHTLLATIHVHSERYRTLAALTGERDPIREHGAIFAAAVARDAEGAVEALLAHLNETVRLIEKTTLLPRDKVPDAEADEAQSALPIHRSPSGEAARWMAVPGSCLAPASCRPPLSQSRRGSGHRIRGNTNPTGTAL